MKKLALIATFGAGAVLLSAQASAVVLFDSGGFESYTVGNLIGQNTWVRQGTATYNVAGTTNKYATVSGTGTSYAFPALSTGELSYTPAVGEKVVVDVDMARTVGTTATLSSANFNLDLYDEDAARITRFGLSRNATTNAINLFVTAPFNTVTSQFDAASPIFNVSVTGALTAGTFYNLSAELNFDTQSYDLFSGGTLVVGNIPFAKLSTDPALTNFADADFSVGTGTGNDLGAIDNYRISTIAAVPEPATMAALGLGAAALLRRRRKNA